MSSRLAHCEDRATAWCLPARERQIRPLEPVRYPAWRPLRAFDDGRQVFIEFPSGIGQGDMPPLFVIGPSGKTTDLVNYRVRGADMIVDTLFAEAELQMGDGSSQQRVRIVRTDGIPAP